MLETSPTHLALALALAALASVASLAAARGASRAPGALLLALVCAPVALVLLDRDFRIYSHHGLLHASYVHSILEQGLPPRDPLFAASPLLYPWAHHALVAGLTRLSGLAPSLLFAATNLVLLAISARLLYSTARRMSFTASASVFATLFSLYGVSPLPRGPGALLVTSLLGEAPDRRVIPVQKFASVNSNSFGILFFAWGLYALVRWSGRGDGSGRAALVQLFLAVLGAALFYPLAWAPLVAVAGVSLALEAWRRRSLHALLPLVSVALAGLLAAPYLISVQLPKEPAASLGPTVSAAALLGKLLQILLVLLVPAVLAWSFRSTLRDRSHRTPGAALVLGSAVVVGCSLYLVLSASLRSEYKFLALATVAAGLPMGLLFDVLWRRHALGAGLLLFAILLPAASSFTRMALNPWGPTGRIREVGGRLEHADPGPRELHRWARERTDRDATFVDTELELPVFAGRPLYFALDPPDRRALAGWGFPPSVAHSSVVAHRSEEVRRRRSLTRALLTSPGRVPAAALAELRRDVGSAPVYVVAREPRLAARLAADPSFEEVFRVEPIAVYRVTAGSQEPDAAPAAGGF